MWYFFPHMRCLTDIALYLVETVRSTRPRYAQLAYPFALVRLANTAPLILHLEANQRQSVVTPEIGPPKQAVRGTCTRVKLNALIFPHNDQQGRRGEIDQLVFHYGSLVGKRESS